MEQNETPEEVDPSFEYDDSIPWEKIQQIQEAVKPLGYVLEGYREKRGRRIILYLSPAIQFIRLDEGNK